jgi:hypothetical protein
MSKIDWHKCAEFSCRSLVKVACDFWNNGTKATKDIGSEIGLSSSTIVNYLKAGSELGWCDYNSNLNKTKSKIKCTNTKNK